MWLFLTLSVCLMIEAQASNTDDADLDYMFDWSDENYLELDEDEDHDYEYFELLDHEFYDDLDPLSEAYFLDELLQPNKGENAAKSKPVADAQDAKRKEWWYIESLFDEDIDDLDLKLTVSDDTDYSEELAFEASMFASASSALGISSTTTPKTVVRISENRVQPRGPLKFEIPDAPGVARKHQSAETTRNDFKLLPF